MAEVSILVAVYNTSKYLHKCMDSLLNQSFNDIEIICIDDCSTDDSLSILSSYAERDSRVKVIHLKQNTGLAHARNEGLKQATGNFICMVDSDDWISTDAIGQSVNVFRTHTKCDCVLFRFVLAYDENGKFRYEDFKSEDFEVMSGEDACLKSLTWQIHGIYIVRSEIHKKYPYDETCRLYSDENTTRVHYLASREVRQCEGVYYYRQHVASMTHKISVRRFDVLRAKESLMRFLVRNQMSSKVITEYENIRWLNVIDTYMFFFAYRNNLTKEERRFGLNEIHRIWRSIDRSCIKKNLQYKFGFMPFHFSWLLFRLQEESYFTLKKWIKGDNSVRFN
jgi:glycosyltransferase involved in cell wall biosynthesis